MSFFVPIFKIFLYIICKLVVYEFVNGYMFSFI